MSERSTCKSWKGCWIDKPVRSWCWLFASKCKLGAIWASKLHAASATVQSASSSCVNVCICSACAASNVNGCSAGDCGGTSGRASAGHACGRGEGRKEPSVGHTAVWRRGDAAADAARGKEEAKGVDGCCVAERRSGLVGADSATARQERGEVGSARRTLRRANRGLLTASGVNTWGAAVSDRVPVANPLAAVPSSSDLIVVDGPGSMFETG